jgi:hypothetical protein
MPGKSKGRFVKRASWLKDHPEYGGTKRNQRRVKLIVRGVDVRRSPCLLPEEKSILTAKFERLSGCKVIRFLWHSTARWTIALSTQAGAFRLARHYSGTYVRAEYDKTLESWVVSL